MALACSLVSIIAWNALKFKVDVWLTCMIIKRKSGLIGEVFVHRFMLVVGIYGVEGSIAW